MDNAMLLPAQSSCVELSETGLVLSQHATFDEWLQVGASLKRIDRACQWWIGDWLNAGEARWGEMYAQAVDETDMHYDTLAQYKWVAKAIPFCTRVQKVPFTVCREIASLPSDQRADAIQRAADEGWTVREAKQQVRSIRALEGKVNPAPLPTDTYRVLYADPPWRYNDQHVADGFDAVVPDTHYPTMPTADICAMQIPKMLGDAVLFLWGTFPMLEDALQVVRAWGFTYKTAIVWDKQRANLGHYHKAQGELLLIATKGACAPWTDTRPDQIVAERAGRHSEKPEKFREIIDQMYPPRSDGAIDRIELFRRGVAPVNWHIWGNEADV